MTDTTASPPRSRRISTRPATPGSRASRRSCASRASRRCRSTPRTSRRAAEWLAAALRAAGIEHVEVVETGGHPVVYGDWLHAEGAPTVLVYGHYDVQPVDPLDVWTTPPFEPVVDGDRMLARGRADDKGQIHAHLMAAGGPARDPRPVPDQRQVRLRGRGGGRPASTSTRGSRPTATASPRTSRSSATPASSRATCRRSRSPARPDVRPDRRRAVAGRPPLGRLRRRRPQPGHRAGPDHRRAQGPGRPRPHPRLLRRRRRADARPSARRSPPCRSTRRRSASRSACRRSSARPATRRSSASRPARRSTSTASGAGSRAMAPRRSSRPRPTPRSAAGSSPHQDPHDIFDRLAAFVDEIAPPGVTVTVRPLGGGRPSAHPDRSPGDAGRGARARGDVRAGAGVHPRGRLDPGRGELRVDPRPAGRAPRLHPAPRATPTPPTSGSTCATTRAPSGPSSATFDEIAGARTLRSTDRGSPDG